jgi:hypothetical protein
VYAGTNTTWIRLPTEAIFQTKISNWKQDRLRERKRQARSSTSIDIGRSFFLDPEHLVLQPDSHAVLTAERALAYEEKLAKSKANNAHQKKIAGWMQTLGLAISSTPSSDGTHYSDRRDSDSGPEVRQLMFLPWVSHYNRQPGGKRKLAGQAITTPV